MSCLRRSWLLGELSALLDYERGRPARLRELLALPDERLIDALAGSRKQSLHAAHDAFRPDEVGDALDTICRHRDLYPAALKKRRSSAALHVGGSMGELGLLTQRPLVAIVGSRRPSDYGVRVARSLARGLTASGVTVLSGLQPGIAEAAHRGAFELHGGTIGVTGDGLGFARGARSSLYAEIVRGGCVLGELGPTACGRGWSSTVCDDMLLALASVFVVIEAEEGSREMITALLAMEQGALVAAVPGRVESPLAAGSHALITNGACLVRGPGDLLELLYEGDAPARTGSPYPTIGAGLPAHLKTVLAQVLSGDDTPEKILADCTSAIAGLAALSELELAGLIVRTAGGRYVPGACAPARLP